MNRIEFNPESEFSIVWMISAVGLRYISDPVFVVYDCSAPYVLIRERDHSAADWEVVLLFLYMYAYIIVEIISMYM